MLEPVGGGVEEARELEVGERAFMGSIEAVGSIQDSAVPGPAGDIPIRIYTPPHGNPPFSILIFIHGGGWVMGSMDQADPSCRRLAAASGHVVVSVGYRLAPEHPFPAGLEDSYAVMHWVDQNRGLVQGNDEPLAVAGDSAGGNLATAVSLLARDRDGPEIAVQLLCCPALDRSSATESYRRFAEGYWLTRETVEWCWDLYLADGDGSVDPYACPLRSKDLRNLPPALILTAEFDVLRDEGEQYAQRLREARVPVRLSRYQGQLHSFWEYAGVIRNSAAATAEMAGSLRSSRASRWLDSAGQA